MIESKVVMSEEAGKDEYPKLMIARDGSIILFTDYKTGVCVHGEGEDVGDWSDEWAMGVFEPFHGTITLTSK